MKFGLLLLLPLLLAPPALAQKKKKAEEKKAPAPAPAAVVVPTATPVAPAPAVVEKPKILVIEPTSDVVDPPSLRSIASLVTLELTRMRALSVISTADVKKLSQVEAQRQETGCDQASCLSELAGAMGTRYVVFGDVGKLGSVILLNLNLFDSTTAQGINRVTLKLSSLEEMADRVGPAARELVAPLFNKPVDEAALGPQLGGGGNEPVSTGTLPRVSEDPQAQKLFRQAVEFFYAADFNAAVEPLRALEEKAGVLPLPAALYAQLGPADGSEKLERAALLVGKREDLEARVVRFLWDLQQGKPNLEKPALALMEDLENSADGYFSRTLLAFVAPIDTPNQRIKWFEALWTIDPSPAIGYADLAYPFCNASNVAAMRELCEQVLAQGLLHSPTNRTLLLTKARARYQQGKTDEARRILDELLRKHPTSTGSRALLLAVLLDQGDRAAEKQQLAALTSGTLPADDVSFSLTNHALRQAARGRVAEARALLEQARQLAFDAKDGSHVARALAAEMEIAAAYRDLDGLDRAGNHLAEAIAPAFIPLYDTAAQNTLHLVTYRRLLQKQRAKGNAMRSATVEAELKKIPDRYFPPRWPKPDLLAFLEAEEAVRTGKKHDALDKFWLKSPGALRQIEALVALADAKKATKDDVGYETAVQLAGATELSCLSSADDLDQLCRVHLVENAIRQARLDLDLDKNPTKAKRTLDNVARLWPAPDEDLPLAKELASLKARVQ